MVQITIDTQRDSVHEIQRVIALLQQVVHGIPESTVISQSAPVQNIFASQSASQLTQQSQQIQQSSQAQRSNGFTDMFAAKETPQPVQTMPSSTPQTATSPFSMFDDQSVDATALVSSQSQPGSQTPNSSQIPMQDQDLFRMFSSNMPNSSPSSYAKSGGITKSAQDLLSEIDQDFNTDSLNTPSMNTFIQPLADKHEEEKKDDSDFFKIATY